MSKRANTSVMNAHLVAIGAAFTQGSVGVVVLEAGWRGSRETALPDNIALLKLPPWIPELNPMETVLQYLRKQSLANRGFEDIAAAAGAANIAQTEIPVSR